MCCKQDSLAGEIGTASQRERELVKQWEDGGSAASTGGGVRPGSAARRGVPGLGARRGVH